MLQLETLKRKPPFIVPSTLPTQTIIDLTAASFDFKEALTVTTTTLVSDDLVMRPDIVAKIYYGDSNKVDFICKFNGISNPFSLDAGQILMIGDELQIANSFSSPPSSVDPEKQQKDLRDSYFDPNRLNKKDTKRLDYIQKKAASLSNPSATNLPPNFAQPGAQEITVKDGKVLFGKDVVANKDNCPEVLSRARVKSKLLENKIFKKI